MFFLLYWVFEVESYDGKALMLAHIPPTVPHRPFVHPIAAHTHAHAHAHAHTNAYQGVSLFLARPFVPGERVSLYLAGGGAGARFLSGVVERVDPARTTIRDDAALPHLLPNSVVAGCVVVNESRAALTRTAAMMPGGGGGGGGGGAKAEAGKASSSSPTAPTPPSFPSSLSPLSWRSAPRSVSLSFPIRLEDAHLGPAIALSVTRWLSACALVDKRLPKGASLSAVVEGAGAGSAAALSSPSSLSPNATATLSVSAYLSAAAANNFTSFRQELLLVVIAAAKEAGSSKGGGGRDGSGSGSGSKNNAVPFSTSPLPPPPPPSSHPASSSFPFAPREKRPQDL